MKWKWLSTLFVTLALILFVTGCENDDSGYDGVGRLVAERNRSRLAQKGDKKLAAGTPAASSSKSTNAKSSNEMLSQEDVHVINASSGKLLAKGTAYLDENGKIITIRIK